jgi:hypothetical protein
LAATAFGFDALFGAWAAACLWECGLEAACACADFFFAGAEGHGFEPAAREVEAAGVRSAGGAAHASTDAVLKTKAVAAVVMNLMVSTP